MSLEQGGHDDPARPVVVTSLAGLEAAPLELREGDLAALAAAATTAGTALRTGQVTGATPGAVNVAALLLEQAGQAHDHRDPARG